MSKISEGARMALCYRYGTKKCRTCSVEQAIELLARDFYGANEYSGRPGRVIDYPVRATGNKLYWFDNGVYTNIKIHKEMQPEWSDIYADNVHWSFASIVDVNIWRKAAVKFRLGSTLRECLEIYLATDVERPRRNSFCEKTVEPRDFSAEPENMNRLVAAIERPEIERAPEHQDLASFDHIRVTVGLPKYMFASWSKLREAVLLNEKAIRRQVVDSIEKNFNYRQMGHPEGYLRVQQCTLCKDYSLEYIFVPKQ